MRAFIERTKGDVLGWYEGAKATLPAATVAQIEPYKAYLSSDLTGYPWGVNYQLGGFIYLPNRPSPSFVLRVLDLHPSTELAKLFDQSVTETVEVLHLLLAASTGFDVAGDGLPRGAADAADGERVQRIQFRTRLFRHGESPRKSRPWEGLLVGR